MAAPSKAEQVAEARTRAESGTDPNMEAGAVDTIDDGAPGEGDTGGDRARTASGDGDAASRPAPPARGRYDDKRAAIINRFRTQRTVDAEEARDDISDFQRSGMPPEFEQPQPEPVVAGEEAIEEQAAPAADAAPQKVRLKVRGQEIEMPLEEVIAKAQIAVAADDYLDEAKGKLKQVDDLLRETTAKAPRGAQPGQHQAQPTAQPQPEPGNQAQPEGAAGEHQADDVQKLIEAIQFGADPEEARNLLENTISTRAAATASRVVDERLQADRLRDEGARGQKQLADFLGQNADIAGDPRARAVVEYSLYEQQVEDIKALGIDPNQIPTAHGGTPTSGEIAQAHQWYRANGFKVKTPKEMLETAVSEFKTWKGTGKPPEPAVDTARTAPRVDLTVTREARRQTAQQQPTRTVAPSQQQQPAPPAPRDRSAIVQDMMKNRGKPRGRIVA